MTAKIFKSIFAASLSVLVIGMAIIIGVFYDYYGKLQNNELRDRFRLVAAAVESDGKDYLSKLTSDEYRFTLIAKDGSVIFDTKADADGLDNHSSRPEVKDAFEKGVGESSRYSSTLTKKTVYYAAKLSDGSVLRVSSSYASIWFILVGFSQPLLLTVAVGALLSFFIAKRLSKKIVEPVNALNLDAPLENDAYDELAPLLERLDSRQKELAGRIDELRRKKDEFLLITENMKEGLVLTDEKCVVISVNPAAMKIFGTDEGVVGSSFLEADRTPKMTDAIKKARENGSYSTELKRRGRDYSFSVSSICSNEKTVGFAIIATDITERKNAESARREFTANVSHELKTPLQGIIGSAELLKEGMVKECDVPRFSGHIYDSAKELYSLIEDIIRLSQLDEGEELPKEPVKLLELSSAVASKLSKSAAENNVTVSVFGEETELFGTKSLIYEIIYNLCDNAVKYNVPGGKVSISVSKTENDAEIDVSDTGIGISPEDKPRIFERFYRADKSHSKESGGTGLGLSIVKHAVLYHGGKISVESELNRGTRFRVILPLNNK